MRKRYGEFPEVESGLIVEVLILILFFLQSRIRYFFAGISSLWKPQKSFTNGQAIKRGKKIKTKKEKKKVPMAIKLKGGGVRPQWPGH